MDNHPNILHGAPLDRIVDMSLGELLVMVLNVYEENTLLVRKPFSLNMIINFLIKVLKV